MAGPSIQDIQEQIRQTHQGAPTNPQQPPLPTPPAGGGYVPPPPPPPVYPSPPVYPPPPGIPPLPGPSALPQNLLAPYGGKPKGTIINIGKVSLFAITFSLVFFGAFTFLTGLLLGMWLAGPSPTPTGVPSINEEPPILGLIPSQQVSSATTYQTSPQGQWIPEDLSKKAGEAAEESIKTTKVHGVPDFLAPLVTATQTAAAKQIGHKMQQRGARQPSPSNVTPVPSPPPSVATPQPQTPYAPSSSMPPVPAPSPFPVVSPTLSASLPPPGTLPLSRSDNGSYTIQLGVFAAKENADALVNQMQALNYTSHVVEGKAPDGSTLYYVHSGLYNDYNAALDTASHFASQNIPGATVVQVTKNNKGAS